MSTHRLDAAKLMRDVDRARRAGAPDELPLRQVAAAIGVRSSMFTRLRRGERPDADSLCSLLMWLSPRASLAEYALWVTDGRRELPLLGVEISVIASRCHDAPLRCSA